MGGRLCVLTMLLLLTHRDRFTKMGCLLCSDGVLKLAGAWPEGAPTTLAVKARRSPGKSQMWSGPTRIS
jgi:hypothetical protein